MRMTSSDGDDGRVPTDRGIRMTAVLYHAGGGSQRSDLRRKVKTFNDHKGTLEVTWAECPTFAEVFAIGRAWVQVANESLTIHAMADGRPLCDQDGDRWTFDADAVGLMLDAEAGDVAVCVPEEDLLLTSSAG